MKKEGKKISRALHRVSPRTMSESQSTLLRNTSCWLLLIRSITKNKKKQKKNDEAERGRY